ncbi:hypothetical protein IAT38_000505 [Cryptococcus sp. DSM 104549]
MAAAPTTAPSLFIANAMLAPSSSSPSTSSPSSSALPPVHHPLSAQSQTQTQSKAAHRFFPGFLATADDDLSPRRSASPNFNYSSEPDSPTGLPYLRDSPDDHPLDKGSGSASASSSASSSQAPAASSGTRDPPSAPKLLSKAPPPLPTVPGPNPHRSLSTSTQGSTSSSTSGSESRGSSSGVRPMTAPLVPRKEARSPVPRKRPVPLVLGKAKETRGMDEGIEVQREDERVQDKERERERPVTSVSDRREANRDSLASELKDLSLLRKTVRQNLLARPVDSPLAGSDSGGSTGIPTPDLSRSSSSFFDNPDPSISTIPVSSFLALLRSPNPEAELLVIDTRPLGAYLESHLPRSANISIPSLIFKRFRKSSGTGSQSIGWDALGGFVSTQEGKNVWQGLDVGGPVEVVILGGGAGLDDLGKVIYGIMEGLVERGSVRVLQGGWAAVMASEDAAGLLVSGDNSAGEASTSRQGELAPLAPPLSHGALPPPPKSAPAYDMPPVPPILPSSPPRAVTHRPSLPSLRTDATKRNLPSLSISGGGAQHPGATQRRTPKLSLNLDKPLRSATLGAFPGSGSDVPPTPGGHLSVNSRNPRSPGFSLSIPKSPYHGSFHTLCHEQSKLPPSPSSFGDVRRVPSHGGEEGAGGSPETPWSNATPTPRAPGYSPGNGMRFSESPHSATLMSATTVSGAGGGGGGGGAGRNGMAPFVVSTILPSFLYLGPDIATPQDVEVLRSLGVKRILNVAKECDDDQGLGLKGEFKYHRVPMRDIVEESGVAQGMRDACDFLDDARLHSAPTYVHCQAGKSRSVTVVLAYLIHANAWTLKTSYAYVAERRKGISPNIGFVAELMQFEEAELGLKQSGGVHGEGGGGRKAVGGGGGGGGGGRGDEDDGGKGGNPRYMRESLPPTWSASVDSYGRPPKISPIGAAGAGGEEEAGKENGGGRKERERERERYGDEREVRKNGQWVHHRRAPVDRTTLQPGRRVSKAGLESLRPLNTTTGPSPKPSPAPSPGVGGKHPHAATPGGEGPLRWV